MPSSPPAPPPPLAGPPLSRSGVVTISALVVACLAVGDALTGTEASFILLYLAPIAFTTWFATARAGVGLSVLCAVLSTATDLSQREVGPNAAVVIWNFMIQLGTYLTMTVVLSAFKTRLEGEQLLARTDALTQLSNRRAFIEAASLELERARRHGRPFTIAYVDADDFKFVNDALGHAVGDALLAEVGRTLRGATRAVDAVARLGGDEFGLLLPETDGPTAEALLGRLRAALLQAMQRHGWKVGFSVGAATFLAPPASVDEMMARADELMYEAKRAAKGTIRAASFGQGGGGAAAQAAAPDGT